MYECPWDGLPVEVEQATCDINCYHMWIRFKQEIVSRPKLIAVESWQEIPLDLEDQPWYNEMVRFS